MLIVEFLLEAALINIFGGTAWYRFVDKWWEQILLYAKIVLIIKTPVLQIKYVGRYSHK